MESGNNTHVPVGAPPYSGYNLLLFQKRIKGMCCSIKAAFTALPKVLHGKQTAWITPQTVVQKRTLNHLRLKNVTIE